MNNELDPALIAKVMAMEDPENDPEQMKIARQQKMLEALRSGALQGSQGRMVGDRFVAPSAAAQVMNLGTTALGGFQQRGLDQNTAGLAKQRQGTRTDYMKAMIQAMRGQPQGPMGPQAGDPAYTDY